MDTNKPKDQTATNLTLVSASGDQTPASNVTQMPVVQSVDDIIRQLLRDMHSIGAAANEDELSHATNDYIGRTAHNATQRLHALQLKVSVAA